MSYWQRLSEARRAVADGRLRDAELVYRETCSARDADRSRVFFTENIPDGMRRAWQRIRGHDAVRSDEGRWNRLTLQFETEFAAAAAAVQMRAREQQDLGAGGDPEGVARLLEDALFLAVDTKLVERTLAPSPLLVALFRLLPETKRLCDPSLLPPAEAIPVAVRLEIGEFALAGLSALDGAARRLWTGLLVELLTPPDESDDGVAWDPASLAQSRWVVAKLVDDHVDDIEEVLGRWEACDHPGVPDHHRRWARLRCLEILSGCDRRCMDVPQHAVARALAARLPAEGDDETAVRCRAALQLIDYRSPLPRPDHGWLSGAVTDDGGVRFVFWWGACPRDVISWRPHTPLDRVREVVVSVGGRVVWHGAGPPDGFLEQWQGSVPGRVLRPYLDVFFEDRLPPTGWSDDLARGLALARSGAWRDDWRADLGHDLLTPPGQDGRLQSDQDDLAPALHTGLLWLAVLHRLDTADPALRAGLGELGRRGDCAASFLHACAVLGAPDKAAVDESFAPWTLPLLWTRPDPTTGNPPDTLAASQRPELAGQDVAVVVSGRPEAAIRAWGEEPRRWRIVMDAPRRLTILRALARDVYGSVTVVPCGGRVHDLGAALGRLSDLIVREDEKSDLLAVLHWRCLVESHNGDLLDFRILRPRPAGACPVHDRYVAAVADLPCEIPATEDHGGDGWGEQYMQRVRRSGVVIGLASDLPAVPHELDVRWGVYDGSEASWIFLDSAAIHWGWGQDDPVAVADRHRVLASRGRRHLSLLSGRGAFAAELSTWYDTALAPYGRPYHADLADGGAPRLRLAGRGPQPNARLRPDLARLAALNHVRDAGDDTVVQLPVHELEARFWRAAAAGEFGPVEWVTSEAEAEGSPRRLVIPRLRSLDDYEAVPPFGGADAGAWKSADERRTRLLDEQRRRAALELAAVLAEPVAMVDLLDTRWWRLLSGAAQEPTAALSAYGGESAEFFDLSSEGGDVTPESVMSWLGERGAVPGLLEGWGGPPLAEAEEVELSGLHLHGDAGRRLWRDLAAACLAAWEGGGPAVRLLLIADTPPPGSAALVSAMNAPLSSVVGETLPVAPGPVLWARPAHLLAALRAGADLGEIDAVLVDGVDGLLPGGDGDPESGPRLLGWLAAQQTRRIDLVGGPLAPAWTAFLSRKLGGEVHVAGQSARGWSVVRRGAVPRPVRRCPQCGLEAAGALDGLVCAECSFDLSHAVAPSDTVEEAAARARILVPQADLGRDEHLEIFGTPPDLVAVRRVATNHGAASASHDALSLTFDDGRCWALRLMDNGARASASPTVLLRPPVDPVAFAPTPPEHGDRDLLLMYDRHDLARPRGLTRRVAVDRLLEVLRRDDAPGDRGFVAAAAIWRLAWQSGMPESDVRSLLDLLRWAALLDADDPLWQAAAPARSNAALRIEVSRRDMDLQLAALAARVKPTVAAFLAGTVAGAWHTTVAPGTDALDEISGEQLDVFLGLAGCGTLAGPGLVYTAEKGAWFSKRRTVGRLDDSDTVTMRLAEALDEFGTWLGVFLSGFSRVDRGYLVEYETDGDSAAALWILLGQQLGFWTMHRGHDGPDTPAYVGRATLVDLIVPAIANPESATCRLVTNLADEADAWRERLLATPVGGQVIEKAVPTPVTGTRRWWRRGDQDPTSAARQAVVASIAGAESGTLVLAGTRGCGRHRALVAGLAASPQGRSAEIWCPDAATAVRVHLLARSIDPTWSPDVRPWLPSEGLPTLAPRAPGQRRPVVVAELQRWPREARYRLHDAGRSHGLVLTVDVEELPAGESWEDLYVTTPRQSDIVWMRTQILQARLPWELRRPLLANRTHDKRSWRRDRGSLVARKAQTIDECAAALTAAVEAGSIGSHVQVVAPHDEDVSLLARALDDRGWAAAPSAAVADLLVPGILELVAAMADAHRVATGEWPGGPGASPKAGEPLLVSLLEADRGRDWEAWLRSLPTDDLAQAARFLDRLRRSPWGFLYGRDSRTRARVTAWIDAVDRAPDRVVPAPIWSLWRLAVGRMLRREDVAPLIRSALLTTASEPAGELAESQIYVCFGSEPEAVHRSVFGRVSDRLLVLYQERSPLPGDNEPTVRD